MTKILLIGGNGFIGRNLGMVLALSGNEVVSLARSQAAIRDPYAVSYVGDYRDGDTLNRALEGVDVVVHLAHGSLQLSQSLDLTAEYEANISPTVMLMEQCLKNGIERFIFVSSGGTVYGDSLKRTPLVEDSATAPISLYGTTKLILEHMIKLYVAQRNLPALIVRPANAYGPGQIPFKGQGLVATALASAAIGKPVNLFGDGSPVRDYVHVADVANAIADLINLGEPGQIYNIGSGIGTSTADLLETHILPLVSKHGHTLEIQRLPERSVDVSYNVLNIEKLARCTGYTPIPLELGLKETWEWILANRALYA